ncbi:hypothetical protein C1I95_12455 [Micromonospora craterilacus]|uniref:HK97 gp10 family phage protein n=1 Tax=Micromonospora craterilacus TaxID=1655439 RepID=A0A2W2E8W3_9ACTN|nr:hypothetical protein [Micromonospora craterilacus]PZG18983.1 hypothetical protein C1I95_12455 [Micromonospora craterilacus]
MVDRITVRVDGVWPVLRDLQMLPADADQETREVGSRLAVALSGRVAANARADSRQSALMAPTVRPVPGREPSIVAGGSARVGRRGTPAYKILFGSEFGARTYRQFRPHLGGGSYWMWEAILAAQHEINSEAGRGVDRLVRAFDRGV